MALIADEISYFIYPAIWSWTSMIFIPSADFSQKKFLLGICSENIKNV